MTWPRGCSAMLTTHVPVHPRRAGRRPSNSSSVWRTASARQPTSGTSYTLARRSSVRRTDLQGCSERGRLPRAMGSAAARGWLASPGFAGYRGHRRRHPTTALTPGELVSHVVALCPPFALPLVQVPTGGIDGRLVIVGATTLILRALAAPTYLDHRLAVGALGGNLRPLAGFRRGERLPSAVCVFWC